MYQMAFKYYVGKLLPIVRYSEATKETWLHREGPGLFIESSCSKSPHKIGGIFRIAWMKESRKHSKHSVHVVYFIPFFEVTILLTFDI